jgi:Holliday junction resolvasome RuvABC endonuclease subunit
MDKFVIGIDPGLGETGLILRVEHEVVIAWHTYSVPGEGTKAFIRATTLADHVIAQIVEWIVEYHIKLLDICIELPIFAARNPASYAKQIRILQEIESGIYYRIASVVQECWVTELMPTESKQLACNDGSADKDMIVRASPFADRIDLNKSTREALADAWAHSLGAWSMSDKRTNYTEMPTATILQV